MSSNDYNEIIVSFNNIKEKISNGNYYYSDDFNKLRKLIGQKKEYRYELDKILHQALEAVLLKFKKNEASFDIIDYFYITDFQPNYLLRVKIDSKDKKTCSQILQKITVSNSLNLNFIKYNENFIHTSYEHNGVKFNKENIDEIKKFIDEENLPHYEMVLNKLLKEYAINGCLKYRRNSNKDKFVLNGIHFKNGCAYNKGRIMTKINMHAYLRFKLFDLKFRLIDNKIKNGNYYINEDISGICQFLPKNSWSKYDSLRNHLYKTYDLVAKKVYEEYSKNETNFSIIDYFYITNIDPIYLLKGRKIEINKNECLSVLSQILPHKNGNVRLKEYNRDTNYPFLSYTVNNVNFDKNDIDCILEFIDIEGLPNYEILINELLKEYATKEYLEYRRSNCQNKFILSKKRV